MVVQVVVATAVNAIINKYMMVGLLLGADLVLLDLLPKLLIYRTLERLARLSL